MPDFRQQVCGILGSYKTLWRVLLAGGIYSFMLFDETVGFDLPSMTICTGIGPSP